MSAAEIAYIAGLIDGEGTIGIYRQTGTKNYMLKLIISNTSPALLAWLRPRFGGGVGKAKRAKPHYRPAWQLAIWQRNAADLIRLCRPYLVIKTAQADLALRFMTDASFHKGRGVSDMELGKRRKYHEEMSRLNHEIHEDEGGYQVELRSAS